MNKWARLAFAITLWPSAGWAVDWKELKPQGFVSDFADVIDTASRSQLNAYCAVVQRSTGAQIALVTIPSLQGEPVDDVAATIFRAWSIGVTPIGETPIGDAPTRKNDGILLLLAIGERRSYLEVGPGLERISADDLHAAILREMRPSVRQSQFGQALMAAAELIGNTIAQSRHVPPTARLPRRIRATLSDALPWPFLIGGFLLLPWLLLWLKRSDSRLLLGLPGGMTARSAWGGRCSGGFGGPDSGDGFGGFGGDSARRRASSDW